MLKKVFRSIIWIVPFLSFVCGYFAAHSFFHTDGVIVPSLIGKPIQEALKEVSKFGINVHFYREKENIDVVEGVVLEQSPKPGVLVKPNQKLFVTLARHPKSELTPYFFGNKYSVISESLKKKRIKSKICWLSSSYPKNFCLAQSPEPGSSLGKDDCIAYFSSGKNNLVVVPDFKGRSLLEVKESLEQDGIKVDLFYDRKRKKVSDLVVADQKPMPGMIIDRGRALYVQLQGA